MPRTNHLLTPILLCIFFLCACKKEKTEDQNPSNLRIKTITDNAGGIKRYTYDAQGRMLTAEIDGYFYKEEMKYEPGKATWTLTNADGTFNASYLLNANGLLKTKDIMGDIKHYEFDGQLRLTRIYDNDPVTNESKYFYNAANGLLDSIRTTKGIQWQGTAVYLYYEDKINTVDDKNIGVLFYGKGTGCPVKSILNKRANGAVTTTGFTYTYDEKNRIASRSFKAMPGGQSGTETYTYY